MRRRRRRDLRARRLIGAFALGAIIDDRLETGRRRAGDVLYADLGETAKAGVTGLNVLMIA
ncbi:MAG: hypothetical protein NVV62_06305 [Terricaulis sp.]|nr:hypothetical protein [Terricaulis sp.]